MAVHECGITANRSGPSNSGPIEDNFVREIRRRFRRFRGLIRTTVGYQNDALNLTQPQANPESLIVANSNKREKFKGKLITDGGLYTYVKSVENAEKLVKTSVPENYYTSFHNAFGDGLTANAEPRERFEFTTRPELREKFMRWVRGAINDEILEPLEPGEDTSNHWVAQFIRNAYIAGANQATGLLFQQGVSAENPPDGELVQRPISQRALQTLYTRAYDNLQDITDDMADIIREEVTTGFARGYNPRKMADRIAEEVRNIQQSRAETLARSEVMNAHSESMLDTYERQGVTVVAHEWSAANDSRTCPFCERLDGIRMSTQEVRTGSISWAIEPDWKPQNWRLQPPAHPNCRCVLRPIPGASEPITPLSERVHEVFEERADVLQ